MRKPRREGVEWQKPDSYCATSMKYGYATEERAYEVLHKMQKAGWKEKRVYACPWCLSWHLSSKSKAPA